MLAMGMLLEQMGKHVDLYTADRIPAVYQALPGAGDILTVPHVDGPYDAAILLECDGLARAKLRGLDKFFLINIDHHASGQEFGNLNWIDRHAASVGELVYRLAKAAGATITPEMATCLYTSVLTDTGSFCYGSTRAATFGWPAIWCWPEPTPSASRAIFTSLPPHRACCFWRGPQQPETRGPAGLALVTHQDVVRTCAAEEDCEGIVNFAIAISGVEAAAFLREMPDHSIRLSMRSKGLVNVAALAERLAAAGTKPPPAVPCRGRYLTLWSRFWPSCAPASPASPKKQALDLIAFSHESDSLDPIETQHDLRDSFRTRRPSN